MLFFPEVGVVQTSHPDRSEIWDARVTIIGMRSRPANQNGLSRRAGSRAWPAENVVDLVLCAAVRARAHSHPCGRITRFRTLASSITHERAWSKVRICQEEQPLHCGCAADRLAASATTITTFGCRASTASICTNSQHRCGDAQASRCGEAATWCSEADRGSAWCSCHRPRHRHNA